MWKGRAVSLPPQVAACLEKVFGRSCAHVEVFEFSLFTRLHWRAVATTRPKQIFLRASAADFFDNPWLMLHEYCHVLKQWEAGSLTTPRYIVECLRKGYWNNRYEVEARAFADTHLFHAQALLKVPSSTPAPPRPPAESPANSPNASPEQGLAVVQPAGDEHQARSQRQGHAH